MITSTGRTLFYGSNQVFYALLGADISRFDQREGKWRRPVGLFVDPTTATHSLLHSVGVALEEDKGGQGNHGTGVHHQTNHWLPLPGTISPDQRYFPRTHWQDCFLKRTNLTNARRLEVQTRGNRCVGLYIERHPGYGTPAILGQWDPADTESTRVIHDADVAGTQPLSALKFVFSDQKDITGRVCVDIVVGRGELFTGPVYTHDDLTQVSLCFQHSVRRVQQERNHHIWWLTHIGCGLVVYLPA